MPRDAFEVRRLLEDGISQEVSAYDYDVFELKRFARAAVDGDATLFIRHSERLQTFDIRRIAEEGEENVVFT
jgi:hypothetical protein